MPSQNNGRTVLAEDGPHRVRDLAQGGAAARGLDDRRHEVSAPPRLPADTVEGRLHRSVVAPGPQPAQLLLLLLLEGRVNREQLRARLLRDLELVHPDDDPLLLLDLTLVPVR